MNPFRDRFGADNRRINQGEIPERIRTGIRRLMIRLRRTFRDLFVDVCFIGTNRHVALIRAWNARIEELRQNNQPYHRELAHLREIRRRDMSHDNIAMTIFDYFRSWFNRIENYERLRENALQHWNFLEFMHANLNNLEFRTMVVNELIVSETAEENRHIVDIDKFYRFMNIPLQDPVGRLLYIVLRSGGTLGAQYRLQHAQQVAQQNQRRAI